jgi:hypothetical protein
VCVCVCVCVCLRACVCDVCLVSSLEEVEGPLDSLLHALSFQSRQEVCVCAWGCVRVGVCMRVCASVAYARELAAARAIVSILVRRR